MKNKTAKLASVALIVTIAPLVENANAAPSLFDGRYYEVVTDDGVSWEDANAAANAMSFMGIQGHLATLTTAEEDEFVRDLNEGLGTSKELWVGGFQQDGSNEPGDGWQWINGELIAATNTDAPYTNWEVGEPNDKGDESHLGIGLKGVYTAADYGWNDEHVRGNIGGYVVEYGDQIVVDPNDCEFGGAGCDLGGIIAIFPPGAVVDPDADLTVTSMRINGDDVRCGQSTLELFDGDVEIPKYLCGSPDFIVLKTESDGVEIPEGTVFVENETEVMLPDNDFVCEDPIVQNFPIAGDPQDQDIVAWQSTDRTQMVENDLGVGLEPYPGSVAELSDGCGSSKGRTRSNSYYFIGLHIDFGDANDWAVNQAGNFDSFVALTRYKLVVLQEAVKRAHADDALSTSDYRSLLRHVGLAIRLLDFGNYAGARTSILNFLALAETADYDTGLDFNHNGEHLMRGSNIEFMLRVKVIPYIF